MHRDRLADLNKWRTHPDRKPLILRGCRQVGKSWLVRKFAESFEGFLEINFEKDKSIRQYFTGDLNINVILEKLAIHTNTVIHPGNTLIFFDEIQECEDALKLLRYFKEEKPELHVIAAGSLLEFALENVGIPVGRIQFLHLYRNISLKK